MYLDLWRTQEVAFDLWINSCHAFDYQKMKDLLLLEQFKVNVPREIEVSLNECDLTNPRCAAELADSYEVAHGSKSSGLIGRRRPHEEKHGGEYQLRRPGDNGAWGPPAAEMNPCFPESLS